MQASVVLGGELWYGGAWKAPVMEVTSLACRRCGQFLQPSFCRFFGASGSWGYSSLFGGGRRDHEGNARLVQLPKGPVLTDPAPKKLNVMKWPSTLNTLGSNYFFNSKHETSFSFYHMKLSNHTNICSTEGSASAPSGPFRLNYIDQPTCVPVDMVSGAPIDIDRIVAPICSSQDLLQDGDPNVEVHDNPTDICLVGHTDDRRVRPISNRTLTNCLHKTTRGFAAQVILEGRGVNAYFKPEFPNLFVRLGIGVKPMDLTRVLLRFTGQVKVFLNKRGTLLTVHGWDKRRTGIMAMYLYGIMRANAYTLKGAHIAFEPVKQKVTKKK
eukprot:GHVS01012292.1.p1 GENE.GHVS01012292.1~~GHVS01012292.1.p1  ORF type:complete len:326 (+),score=4.06 GHVS01012292.1:28-1005(+)